MDGTPVHNKRIAVNPLTISLPDGTKIKSTHVCDIHIPGLPTILTGHIVPRLEIASLIVISVLFESGCNVTFCDKHCDVFYNSKLILRGFKDPATDLWTLPISPPSVQPTLQIEQHISTHQSSTQQTINFVHSISTRANKVKFAHQSLCNPKISSLLKAVRRGFLKGCPNINETLILKYLNPSPATAKGHMKRPRHGIHSTTPRMPTTQHRRQAPEPILLPVQEPNNPPLPIQQPIYQGYQSNSGPALIADDCDASIGNVFCFGVFADKNSGIVYHDMTGNFPFTSLNGSVCHFIMYHYESNSILATPIEYLTDITVFNAYKEQFIMLEEKGFKPKLNIMDNQATKHIKKFLTENECRLQLVEPHNKNLIDEERAIQKGKDA